MAGCFDSVSGIPRSSPLPLPIPTRATRCERSRIFLSRRGFFFFFFFYIFAGVGREEGREDV